MVLRKEKQLLQHSHLVC